MREMTYKEFAQQYCEVMDSTPKKLLATLQAQRERYSPIGWLLLQCIVMDSSRLGHFSILPYGPNNGLKEIPDHPVSPRGLASDISEVAGVLPVGNLP